MNIVHNSSSVTIGLKDPIKRGLSIELALKRIEDLVKLTKSYNKIMCNHKINVYT